MKNEIKVKAFLGDEPKCQVLIVYRPETGDDVTRHILSREGDWIELPEGTPAPEVCILPLTIVEPGWADKGEDEEPIIEEQPAPCPECNGLGFEELQAGTIQVKCEACDGTGIDTGSHTESTEVIENKSSPIGTEYSSIKGYVLEFPEPTTGEISKICEERRSNRDGTIGTDSDNQSDGGGDSGQSTKSGESKARGKARKKPV